MSDDHQQFAKQVRDSITKLSQDLDLQALSLAWIKDTAAYGYTYNFSALGLPIIQLPQDIVAMQELIWQTKPDLIVETGIARGGSLILSASMLLLLEYCEAVEEGRKLDALPKQRKVLGIDIDVRAHNRARIEAHPLASRIELIEGSSISAEVVAKVRERAKGCRSVLVFLDSDHTHEHVLAELNAYAPMVTVGSYCVVFDTVIEDRLPGSFPGRRWDRGNNPKTAVWEYVKQHPEFQIDKDINARLLITSAPDGYLKRVA